MSIGLAIGLVGLTSLALALLLLPLLLRQSRQAPREAYNLTVYREQLAEVERDLARGLLSPEQAKTTRAEIGRRILALDSAENPEAANPAPLAAAVIGILLLPIAALLIYARLGSPALPDRPFAARTTATGSVAEQKPPMDMQEALAKLRAHLEQHPDDLTGQLLLARSELSLGHYQEAAEAYRHAADLSGHRADIVGDWGEAQVLAAGGKVTPGAREAFEAGLKDPETAPRARYYLALARMQDGDVKDALQAWVDLEADSPAEAEWLPLLRQRIAEAAGTLGVDPASLKTSAGASRPAAAAGPSAAQPGAVPSTTAVAAMAKNAAGASRKERETMINAMVERLAARLEQQPDDVEGWTRLGRSYMVLHRPAKARDAFAHAVRLKPDDTALRQALGEATNAAAAGSRP